MLGQNTCSHQVTNTEDLVALQDYTDNNLEEMWGVKEAHQNLQVCRILETEDLRGPMDR